MLSSVSTYLILALVDTTLRCTPLAQVRRMYSIPY